jgi:CheY-like chemotaxis protein
METRQHGTEASQSCSGYTGLSNLQEILAVAEVGILVIEDDAVSQGAIKNVLDAEGWRVRVLSTPAQLFAELASGVWSLVIVNVSLLDFDGPLFSILKDLSLAEAIGVERAPKNAGTFAANRDGKAAGQAPSQRGLRVLFLVPVYGGKEAQARLDREGLPYTLKPYHLHDFLEKVSELLLETGTLEQPMRTMFNSLGRKKVRRDMRKGEMFASREDYQMTEEEMTEFTRQEEEESRKKREKELKERSHR